MSETQPLNYTAEFCPYCKSYDIEYRYDFPIGRQANEWEIDDINYFDEMDSIGADMERERLSHDTRII